MVKRLFIFAGIFVVLCVVALSLRREIDLAADSSQLPPAETEAEGKILMVLEKMVKMRQTYLNVPVQDGKALRLFAESTGARNVVEIGTSTGYSGLWFCLALQSTGGHLTTFEIDPKRAAMARAHFEEAGVENLVTIVQGDAHKKIADLKGPIDVVFIDADKEGYVDYLNQLLPLVRPGGLILAHNIDMVRDYVRAISSNPGLETIFYKEGNGLSITMKKR